MKNELKNPIDQLFQEKLADFEQKPSARAKELFEARLANRKQAETKPRWGMGIYSAAAAVMAIALGAWYFSAQPETAPVVAQTSVSTLSQPVQNTAEPIAEPAKTLVAVQTKPLKKAVFETQKIEDNTPITDILPISNPEVKPSKTPEIEHLDDSIEEMIQKPSLQTAFNKPKQTPSVSNALSPNDEGEVIVTISSIETPTLALDDDNHVSVEEGKNMGRKKLEDAVKRPLVARVFEQLGNLKRGEKVDWEQMGLKKTPDNTFQGRQTQVAEPSQQPALRKPYQPRTN